MDNNLEDFHPAMEESCGSSESSPRRSTTSTKMKRTEWSDSRIIMPFVPLEAIKEEVTPCSSTQRLENNLSVIKNKLRSGLDPPATAPAHFDQRTQLSGETNTSTSVANCLKSNVYDTVNGNRGTNVNYNTSSLQQTRNNLYNIKSKMRKSSSRASSSDTTARNGTKANDGRISNIDSSRDASESNDETKISGVSGNINNNKNVPPPKPARKSLNRQNVNITKGNTYSVPSSAEHRQRNHNFMIVSKNSTPRSAKFNPCIDELKYYNLRNGLSKNPSEETSARKLSSHDEDLSKSNSGLTTGRTDCTDVNVSALFNNKENARESKESNDNSSGNTTTLNENVKNIDNSLDMSECNAKDFKYYLMHSDNKTSSTTNSLNLTESEPNSPDSPVDQNTNTRSKKYENTCGTANVIKSKTGNEKTRIPRKINAEKVVNKNQPKHLVQTEVKYKNKGNLVLNDLALRTKKSKSELTAANSSKLITEPKRKESKYSPVNHTNERAAKVDICTSSKSSAVGNSLTKSRYSSQSKLKHDIGPTNSSKMTKPAIDSNDTADNSCTLIARKKNITIRRRYSVGDSFVTKQDALKKSSLKSSEDQKRTRRTSTYINDNQYDNQKREKVETVRTNNNDCYSKPSDFSPMKSSDSSLKVQGRRVEYYCPSTDGIRDYCSEVTSDNNSKVSRRRNDDILAMSSRNLFTRMRDADDRQTEQHLGMGDFSEYSLATMDYCVACNNYSDLSTQDSFSTNTKDTWTQVHYSDIIKEMKKHKQLKKNMEQAAEAEYRSFLNRQATAAGDNQKKMETKNKTRSRNNTMRNERKQRYRRGRELNFNYDKPVQNYLINSSRQNTRRGYEHDDDTYGCCGCMRFRFFRRIFSRFT